MTVFGGMVAATIFGVVFIPVLYVVFQRLRERAKSSDSGKRTSKSAAKA
jgi:uncharacterized protein (DUF2062 family)